MKEQRHNLHQTRFTIKNLKKPTFYISLLLLSYAVGYLSPHPSTPQTTPAPVTGTTTGGQFSGDHNIFSTKCANPIPQNLIRQTILNKIFNNTSPYTNFPPAHVSTLLRKKRIKGWGSNGPVFTNLITKHHPKTIIEIGTFLGASAIHMAELTQKLGLDTQILCVDDFRGWPGFLARFKDINSLNGDVLLLYQFMQNVVYSNVTGSVIFVPFSTGSVLEKFCEWGIFGDLIEIDAGHDFHSAWADVNRAYKILRPGGVIFGHDYFASADNKGVRRAVNLFARVNGFRVRIDGQHWVIDSA